MQDYRAEQTYITLRLRDEQRLTTLKYCPDACHLDLLVLIMLPNALKCIEAF